MEKKQMEFNWNDQQQDVIDWVVTGEGSLNLIARAGCGKTFTLVQGVVKTIVDKDLGEIALMAYNKAAAEEFKGKLKEMGGEYNNWKKVTAGTVHSFGMSAVKFWSHKKAKVNGKKVAGICGDLALEDFEVPSPEYSMYAVEEGPITKLVSLAKQSGFGFLVSPQDRKAWHELAVHHAINDIVGDGHTIHDVIEASIEVLARSISMDKFSIDFDDMILAPLVHNIRMWPKDWVLIDEAQDTNAARRALALKMLKPKTGRLIAVGDDRQAIYGFTGADADSLDKIADSLNSAKLPLTVTYRCPKAIVAEANRLVPDLVAHKTAPDGIVRSMPLTVEVPDYYDADASLKKVKAGELFPWFLKEEPGPLDVILCRNNVPLIETAYSMLGKGIACMVEGREIGEGLINLVTRWKSIKNLQPLLSKLEDYQEKEIQKWMAKDREDRAQGVEDKVQTVLAIANGLI
ncbi:MAG TPA: ATP-dependent helicase, partial [bacterium]|nr:ATP-dependent helicase [bacterium]